MLISIITINFFIGVIIGFFISKHFLREGKGVAKEEKGTVAKFYTEEERFKLLKEKLQKEKE